MNENEKSIYPGMIAIMNKIDLFDKAVEAWGELAQLDMLQEECAELIQALSKKKRGFEQGDDWVAEEIADVELLIEQVKRMFHLETRVEIVKRSKLERLEERLKDVDNERTP